MFYHNMILIDFQNKIQKNNFNFPNSNSDNRRALNFQGKILKSANLNLIEIIKY